MKNIILKYLSIVLIASTIWSCKTEFLDTPPLSNLTAPTFFNNDSELLASTGALYNIVWSGANGQFLLGLGDGRAGNVVVPYSGSMREYYQLAVTSSNSDLTNTWQSLFNVIAQSNVLMGNVTAYSKAGTTEAARKRAIAEARYMRGLAYSILVQNFGPVPLITDNLKQGADTTLARNTIESVWEFAIRDLQFAKNNLPITVEAGRINKYSAEGLLARFYLTRSGLGATPGNRNQAMLDSAKFYAKDVIENSNFKLLEKYEDLFLTKNNNNPEQLFGLQWVPLRSPWGVGNTFQSQFAANSVITGGADGWGGSNGASYDYLINLDPADSVRRRATFMLPGDHYPELVKNQGGWKEPFPADDSWENFAHFKKYIVGSPADNDGKGDVQATGNNTYMQRLADVYLIYAEAALGNSNETSDPTALKYFNAIRERAKLPAVSKFNLDNVLHERRYEFAVEGDNWYDMVRLYYYNPKKVIDYIGKQERGNYIIRLKKGTGIPGVKREFEFTVRQSAKFPLAPNQFYLPVPDAEISKAPNLRKDPVPYKF